MARHSYDGPWTEDVSVDDAEWLAKWFEQNRARLRRLSLADIG